MVERAEEITAFAAFLTDLKARSGLSYATLAKRLYLSQSTLHRYCNGDAVPTEYAPIERLARLCKATPEEQVELHRRWILADAARLRDRKTAAAQEAPRSDDGSTAPPSVAPTVAQSVAPTVAQSVAPSVAPQTDPAESASPEGTSNTSPRPRRSRRPVLASGAAVALIAIMALVIWNLTSGSDGDPSSEAGPQGTSPTDSPGSVTSPSGTKSSVAGPPAPLALAVNSYAWQDPCDAKYVLNSPPGEVPPPPVEQDMRGWVEALGGVAAGRQRIELTIQGTGKDTVVLQSLNIRVVQSGKPQPGAVYRLADGCGSGVKTKSFDVDLDAGPVRAKPASGQPGFPFKVSESDPEVFYLTSHTAKHDATWYVEVQWSSGTRNGLLRIDDHGKPFRTTAAPGSRGYFYPLGGAKWEPEPPH